MRKSSISLFAVLAIVFAVSSAFTASSKTKPFFYERYQIWGIDDYVSSTYMSWPYHTNDYIDLEWSSKFVLADNPSPFCYTGGCFYPMDQLVYIYENQQFEYMPTDSEWIICFSSSPRICLGYVDTGTQSLLAVLEGQYEAIWE